MIGSRNGWGQFKKKNHFNSAKFSDTSKSEERRPPGFLSKIGSSLVLISPLPSNVLFIVGNRVDVKQPPRVIPYNQGSDVAYTLEYDYYETSAIAQTAKSKSSSADDDDDFGGPTPITLTSDELKEKIDESGDPEMVVMSMVREILRFLPKVNIACEMFFI
jgi:hypothetical protein